MDTIPLMKGEVRPRIPVRLDQRRQVVIINPAEASQNASLVPPVGLALLSAIIKQTGNHSTILDMTFDEDLSRLNQLEVTKGIYLITITTPLVNRARQIVGLIRTKDPNSFIIGGGAHPTTRKEAIFDELDLDAVTIGEVKISQVLEALCYPDWPAQLSQVKGVIYRFAGKNYVNLPVDEWEELDRLPIADYLSLPLEQYFTIQGFRSLSISTSRGCPYRCTYCQPMLISLFGKKVRFTSPKRAVDEIEYVVNHFKLDFLLFADDTFAFHQDRVVEMCKEIIQRRIPILWRCQTRVGLRRDVLEWMKKAGCFLVQFGVESGSQKILDSVNKAATVEMAKETFRHCKEVGLLTHSYLMVGNVGETSETITATIELVKKIRPTFYNIGIATPYPGTYLYEYAKANDILMDPDWDKYNHLQNAPVVKLSEFEPEELPALKAEMELLISKESKVIRDVLRLVWDKAFVLRLLRIAWHNPGMPFRMAKLVKRAILKGGYGNRISNPLGAA